MFLNLFQQPAPNCNSHGHAHSGFCVGLPGMLHYIITSKTEVGGLGGCAATQARLAFHCLTSAASAAPTHITPCLQAKLMCVCSTRKLCCFISLHAIICTCFTASHSSTTHDHTLPYTPHHTPPYTFILLPYNTCNGKQHCGSMDLTNHNCVKRPCPYPWCSQGSGQTTEVVGQCTDRVKKLELEVAQLRKALRELNSQLDEQGKQLEVRGSSAAGGSQAKQSAVSHMVAPAGSTMVGETSHAS